MASDAREVNLAATRITILVSPKKTKQRVLVTCAFGLATVRYSTASEGRLTSTKVDLWPALPAAGAWDWILDEEEGLYVYSTVATKVSRVVKPMEPGSVA